MSIAWVAQHRGHMTTLLACTALQFCSLPAIVGPTRLARVASGRPRWMMAITLIGRGLLMLVYCGEA